MSDGRDLRNRIVAYNGYVYLMGGNNCNSEMLCLTKNQWIPLPSYI